jgi:transposase
MPLNLLAIDVGKYSFHVFGIDEDGLVISRKVSRAKLVDTVNRLDPKIVAMEACGSAHHWGRLFQAAGRTVRLINAYFVKPFVRGSKNDATDAQAIFEAADRPTMRFVPVKSLECQDLQALHRVRDRLVHNRTSLINHTRGLLAEYGVVLPQGATRFTALVSQAIDGAALSELTRELFFDLVDQLNDVDRRIRQIDAQLAAICRKNVACRRLVGMPGVGPIVATALVAAIADGRQFRSGRDLAAWIGLVPRQYTTGGKAKLGGIGRRANHYLRRQIVHGARAVMSQAGRRSDPQSEWMKGVAARRGFNRAVIAVANKMARAAWAMLVREEKYVPARS